MSTMLLALALFALGCDDGGTANPPERAQGKSKSKSKAGAAEEAAAEAAEGSEGVEGAAGSDGADYSYNPIGKRDPFRSFISGPRDEEIRSPTPLQKYEIDQYALVGIVWGIDHPRAMVADPERVGHVIELGTYIGKNWGKVTQITSNEVIVTEEYQTIDGELVTNQVTMALPVEDLGDF